MTVEQKLRVHLETLWCERLVEGAMVDETALRQAIENADIADRARAADRGRKKTPLILDEECPEALNIVFNGWKK